MSGLVLPPSVSPLKLLQHELSLSMPRWRLEQVFHSEGKLHYRRADSQIELYVLCVVAGNKVSGSAAVKLHGITGTIIHWHDSANLAERVNGSIGHFLTKEFECNLLRSIVDIAFVDSGLTASFQIGFSSSYPMSNANVMKPPSGSFCRLTICDQVVELWDDNKKVSKFEFADPRLLSKIRGETLKLLLVKVGRSLYNAQVDVRSYRDKVRSQEAKIKELEKEICTLEGLVHEAAQLDG